MGLYFRGFPEENIPEIGWRTLFQKVITEI